MERPKIIDITNIVNYYLFWITAFGQYGGRHSEIHYDLAHTAMATEIGTAAAIWLYKTFKNSYPSLARTMVRAATAGLILTSLSFGAVVATDKRYQAYFDCGKSITNLDDDRGFLEILSYDFERHMSDAKDRLAGEFIR